MTKSNDIGLILLALSIIVFGIGIRESSFQVLSAVLLAAGAIILLR